MSGLGGGQPRAAARYVMRARWSRWTSIVEAFAHRLPSRRRLDPKEYTALYRELLAECRAAAEGAEPGEPSGLEDLESLVRPWLSLSTLAQVDREILAGLLARCRAVERQLGGRSWPLVLRAAARLALPTMVVAVAGSCVLGALIYAPAAALQWVRGWSEIVWFTVRRSSDVERLAVVAVLVVVVSIRIVSRTARS